MQTVASDGPVSRLPETVKLGRVALIVDNPTRDLSGLALLAGELARRDISVLLVPMNLRQREISALDPDLVVMNYVRKVNQALVGRLLDAGFAIGLLDTEGGVGVIGRYGNVVDHYGNVLADDPQVRDRLDFVCAWGSKVAAKMVDACWYRADQVTVTGSPRFDYYHESLRPVVLDATGANAEVVEPEQKTLLIIGSFPAANPRFNSIETETEQRIWNTGYDRGTVDELRRRDVVAMEATVELTRRLAEEYPEGRFVFRPHPFERVETYTELFADLTNVRIASTGTAEGWILRSAAVVVPNDCTIGVESAMAGVPTMVTGWIVPENGVDAVERAGHRFDGADDLVAGVGKIFNGSFGGALEGDPGGHRAEVDRVVAEWFHRADGRSHVRVAEEIASRLRRGQRSRHARSDLHYLRPDGRPRSAKRAQERFRQLLGLPARFSFRRFAADPPLRWDQSPKAFSSDEVQPILDALNRHRFFGDGEITARAAQTGSDYDFRYRGRSLIVEYRNGGGR